MTSDGPPTHDPATHDPAPYDDPFATPPAPVQLAFRLMLLRSVLSVVSLLLAVLTRSSLRSALHDADPHADAARLDTLVEASLVATVVIGAFFVVVYVVLAVRVREGRNWARITTVVLAALGVFGAITSLVRAGTTPGRIVGVITGILDAVIIYSLLRSDSAPWFRRPRF